MESFLSVFSAARAMSNQCAKKVAGDNRNANLKSFLTDSEDNETPDRF